MDTVVKKRKKKTKKTKGAKILYPMDEDSEGREITLKL
jgi:hypothetical protein